ncbi:hypothetical protein SADUNF_Sadunf05G0008700 [Salix dunnii]|uniref:Bulb-type lectin domain-containing protein n=1 Tax=Salix dunnii TaxID=1413687 RepID=A0A835K656_9ROSI|nr:hypothetical protein SADUNF_Sadunf05G0008700 [Salix dunnii]
MCVKTKPCFWLFVLLWLFVYHGTCFSTDKILVGQSLNVSQTLVSQKGVFELGFFVPGTHRNIYLGIWYRNFADKTKVWVANRESPSNDPDSSKLELLSDGNLVLLKNVTETVWSTALASSMPNTTKAEAMLNLTLPANSKTYQKVSAGRCRLDCIENCSCMAYAYNNNNGCSLWEGDLINLQQSGVADGMAGAEIYIRLAASEPELQIGNGSTRTGGNVKRKLRTALAVAIPTTLITLGLFMYFICLWKGNLTRKGKEYTVHDLLHFDFDTNPGSTSNESSSVDNRKKRWSKNMELPLFSYESVSVATGQFSDKLGEGGFGPVYKAWKLWSSNEASDLMDPTLGDPPSPSMLLRYINIGLLCVQESPADRPTMSDVISMIVKENVVLPDPKQPAFVADRNMADQGQLMSSAGLPSTNNVTITAIDAR